MVYFCISDLDISKELFVTLIGAEPFTPTVLPPKVCIAVSISQLHSSLDSSEEMQFCCFGFWRQESCGLVWNLLHILDQANTRPTSSS